MSSTAYEVALFLASQGVGTLGGDTGWCIGVGREPITPETAVTVYDTGGEDPDTDEQDLLRPTFQVRVRSSSYLNAYDKQEEIRDLLLPPSRFVMGSSLYVGVWMSSDVLSIGQDDNDRHLLVANYRAIKELS